MLYVLYSAAYGDFEFHGVFDGPAGLNMAELLDQFNSNFDHRTLGNPSADAHKIPLIAPKRAVSGSTTMCSGSFTEFFGEGGLIYDTDSFEYKEWEKADRKAREEWQQRRAQKIEGFKGTYAGSTEFEMFLFYLEKDHGCRKVTAEACNL